MTAKPFWTGLSVTVLALALTGCFEKPEVTLHEPGQYMGREDPLLKVSGTSEQQERLAKRFHMVQTDR